MVRLRKGFEVYHDLQSQLYLKLWGTRPGRERNRWLKYGLAQIFAWRQKENVKRIRKVKSLGVYWEIHRLGPNMRPVRMKPLLRKGRKP